MEENADGYILQNIFQSLRSENVDTILSTSEFLETVVIHDFPASVFLNTRDLVTVSCMFDVSLEYHYYNYC